MSNRTSLLYQLSALLAGCVALCAMGSTIAFYYSLNLMEWDFWAHAALTRAICEAPFNPENPFSTTSKRVFLYLPYLYASCAVSKVAGATIISTLQIIGGSNLAAFIVICGVFVKREELSLVVLPITIAMILLFWGDNPWNVSGVLHLQNLVRIISYPSTCALIGALTLYLFISAASLKKPSVPAVILLSLGGALLICTHPITFLFLCALLFGIVTYSYCNNREQLLSRVLLCGVVVCGGVAGVLLCPFGFGAELLAGNGVASDPAAAIFYKAPLARIFPACVLFGVLLFLKPRSPIIFASIPVTALYCYGYFTGKFNYARLLPPYITVIQLYGVTTLLLLLRHKMQERRYLVVICTLSIGASVLLTTLFVQEARYLQSAAPTSIAATTLPSLLEKVPDKSTIVANFPASLILPAYGMHVVAIKGYAPYFQPGYERDLLLIEELFAPSTTPQRVRELLHTCEPYRYLLLSKREPQEALLSQTMSQQLTLSAQNEYWQLYKITPQTQN